MTPPPDYPHTNAASHLIERLLDELKRCGHAGRLFVPRAAIWVNDDTYLEPDLMYLSKELQAQMNPRHWTRADIVVEVLSPSNAVYDRRTKSDTYRAMGVRELWLIDPVSEEVEIRFFEADKTTVCKRDDLLKSEILPKVEIPVSALFS
jgi:Uma2 family endonuclease